MKYFNPDSIMLDWLAEYADGRKIILIGDYSFPNTTKLSLFDYNTPRLDLVRLFEYFLDNLDADDHLYIVSRPCYNDWLDMIIKWLPNEAECLYIGLSTNYEDVLRGIKFEVLPHRGNSEHNELVYKILE
jgi:hypothetical protein